MSLLGALWVLIATLLQLVRQEGVSALDTVWAEDGSVFLTGALSDPLGVLFEPYTGYIHVLPRLVAMIAGAVPLSDAPLILSGGAAFIVALLSLYVLVASTSVFRSSWAPSVLAAMMIALPAAGIEAANNLTNLRWFILFAAFWALLHRARLWAGIAAASTVAASAALSDPLTFLLVPMALFAWTSGDSGRQTIAAVFATGVMIQAGVVVGNILSGAERPPMVGTTEIGDLIGLFGLRVAGSFLVGERLLDDGWQLLGWWFAAASLTVVLLMAAYGILRTRGTRRVLIAGTFAYATVIYAVPVAARGTSPLVPTEPDIYPIIGTRYVVAPILFLMSMALLILDVRDLTVSEVVWRRLRYGLLLVATAVVLANFSVETMRSLGPAWDAELIAADRRCAASGVEEVDVSITPRLPPGVWKIRLQCNEAQQAR